MRKKILHSPTINEDEKLISVKDELNRVARSVDEYLSKGVCCKDADLEKIYNSMRYSLLDAGKRIRPFLVISVAESLGGQAEDAMPFAAALEMIHTYSLIHDDLPCMDNDDFRRGKPSNHKAFGEDIALLAGDALLTGAFSVAASSYLPSDICVKAIACLSAAAGADGMIGGQLLDLEAEINLPDEERLRKIYSLKTGALLRAAAKLGCLAAKITDSAVFEKADRYARNIGTAFQIVDDVLDVCGDEKTLGKPIGSDEKNGKATFVSFHGIYEARKIASDMTKDAVLSISDFPNNEKLVELAYWLLNRQV